MWRAKRGYTFEFQQILCHLGWRIDGACVDDRRGRGLCSQHGLPFTWSAILGLVLSFPVIGKLTKLYWNMHTKVVMFVGLERRDRWFTASIPTIVRPVER